MGNKEPVLYDISYLYPNFDQDHIGVGNPSCMHFPLYSDFQGKYSALMISSMFQKTYISIQHIYTCMHKHLGLLRGSNVADS